MSTHTQLEIEIPIQPPRVTLHRARVLRDELDQKIRARNDRALNGTRTAVAQALDIIVLQLPTASVAFHTLHAGWDCQKGEPVDFVGKRALEQLYELSRFVAGLERKAAR